MACDIAIINLLFCKHYAENILITLQQDIMGAFTTRRNANAGFRAFPEHVVRLQTGKTQPTVRGELTSFGRGCFFKYRTTSAWVFTLTLEARSMKLFFQLLKQRQKSLWLVYGNQSLKSPQVGN